MGQSINGLPHDPTRFNNVIAKVIQVANQLLNSEMAGVMLYNDELRELVLQKPAFKLSDEGVIDSYRIPLELSGRNSVIVYTTGQPYWSNDPLRDPRYRPRDLKLFGTKNTIAVPLETENRRIGIMHVANKREGLFTLDDVNSLSFVAPHLALFIENAVLYERQRLQSEELVKLNNRMVAYQSRLQKLINIHNHLVHQVLDQEGMHVIANALADLIEAPIFVEDAQNNLLIRAEQGEGGSLVRNTSKQVAETGRNPGKDVRYERRLQSTGERVKITVNIGSTKNTIGYLSTIVDPHRVNDDVTMIAIEQGATVLALEMMGERVRVEAESRLHREFVHSLFYDDRTDVENIRKYSSLLAYDLHTPTRVAVLRPGEEADQNGRALLDYSLYNLVGSLVRKAFSGAFAVVDKNNIDMLIPVGQLGPSDLSSKLDEMMGQLSQFYPTTVFSVGVGSLCTKVEDYRKSLQYALKALSLVRIMGKGGGVFVYELLGAYSLILEVTDRNILKEFVNARLGPLLAYDAKRNACLTGTLEEYLRNKGALKETAQDLCIHVSTLKYRLGRIQELLNLDLRQTEHHFDLQLALCARRVLAG